MLKKSNFARGNLSAQLLIAGTSLVLGTNEGLRFPATGSGNTFVGVIWGASYATPEGDATRELIVAYRASGDTFTITRAQEGTSAKQWESGDCFMLVASAAVFDEYETAIGTKVIAPATNTDVYIPQWNGANSKTLKDGLAVPAGGLAGLTALGDKVDKVAGKALSTNDYDDAAETKLGAIEANADVTDAGNVGSSIHGATPKTTMADADKLAIIDTEASNVLKTLSWAYVKSILKTYFDTLYSLLANPYKFLVYRNAALNMSNGSFGVLNFDTEVFDTGNNVVNGVFTAPVNGFYQFNFRVSTEISTNTLCIASLFVDGAEYIRGLDYRNTGYKTSNGFILLNLTVNQTVDVRAIGGAADAIKIGSVYCNFSGFLVSKT